MPLYRGLFHAHSTLSDGKYTPSELRELGRAAGLDFIILCEHTWRLKIAKRAAAIEECRLASDEEFLCMLGLECGHLGRHVVLLGPPELICRVAAPEVVLDPGAMREAGGLTIWAHPAGTAYPSLRPGIRCDYDGWEIWNHYVDGPVPSLPILALLRAQRAEGRALKAIAGADYHDERHRIVWTVGLDLPRLDPGLIRECLRAGAFTIHGARGLEIMGGNAEGPYSPSFGAWAYALTRYALLRMRGSCVWAWRRLRDRLFPRPKDLPGD